MSAQTNAILVRVKKIHKLNNDCKILKGRIDEKKEEILKLEAEGLDYADKAGLKKLSDKFFNVAVKEVDVATIKNFNLFWKFVQKKNAPELMQRRISQLGYREWMGEVKEVPGVGIYKRRSLHITKRKI